MCIPPILAGASLEARATFLMGRTPEPCNWRLIIWKGSCTTNGKGELPPNSDFSSNDEEGGSYRPRSKTPLSESFSYDEDYHHKYKNKSSSSKGLGNDAMSRALNQISRSPFTCRIEGGRLPRWFTQPTLTMYNGRTNPMEHVSHFNQRMALHSKNDALMCKVFPPSLRPMAMRWFDGLGASSIDSFKELI